MIQKTSPTHGSTISPSESQRERKRPFRGYIQKGDASIFPPRENAATPYWFLFFVTFFLNKKKVRKNHLRILSFLPNGTQ